MFRSCSLPRVDCSLNSEMQYKRIKNDVAYFSFSVLLDVHAAWVAFKCSLLLNNVGVRGADAPSPQPHTEENLHQTFDASQTHRLLACC